jgi:hypothetical protein
VARGLRPVSRLFHVGRRETALIPTLPTREFNRAADLAAEERVGVMRLAEALQYRAYEARRGAVVG